MLMLSTTSGSTCSALQADRHWRMTGVWFEMTTFLFSFGGGLVLVLLLGAYEELGVFFFGGGPGGLGVEFAPDRAVAAVTRQLARARGGFVEIGCVVQSVGFGGGCLERAGRGNLQDVLAILDGEARRAVDFELNMHPSGVVFRNDETRFGGGGLVAVALIHTIGPMMSASMRTVMMICAVRPALRGKIHVGAALAGLGRKLTRAE